MGFKWLSVPWSNKTRDVLTLQTWKVTWESRDGKFSGDTKPEMEVFLSKKDAEEFSDSLRAAFKLIRHTSGNSIRLS